MDEKPKYTKLGALVGKTFTVERAFGYDFKKYDPESKRMLVSEKWEEGYRKVYTLDTSEGKLDVGSGQLSSLLEAVYKGGKADIVGRTFEVKSNGKTGMEIRYFFNALPEGAPKQEEPVAEVGEDEIDLADIPF